MKNIKMLIACATVFATNPIFANPIMMPGMLGPGGSTYQPYDPNGKAKATYWNLFDTDQIPHDDDVKQTLIPDCWFASVMISIAKCNGKKLKALFGEQKLQDNGDPGSVPVTIYDPRSLGKSVQQVVFGDTGLNGNDDAGQIWWPSALQQAVKQYGGPGVVNGKFDSNGGFPGFAMSYLTGFQNSWSSDPDFCFKAMLDHADSSPMTFGTKDTAHTLVHNHAYSVSHARVDGDTNLVTLRNPWGGTKEYKWTDVQDDLGECAYLQNFDLMEA